MILFTIDDALSNPSKYAANVLIGEFIDFPDGDRVFKNIQARQDDEMADLVLRYFPEYSIGYNFVRKSPLGQIEPNFIHKDDMMGDITCILYLNETHPKEDGTTIYDDEELPVCKVYAKFNRLVAFESNLLHSRNIFENFGEEDDARLIQVIFLKKNNEQGDKA
jgi:hypothetical protein